MDLRFVRKRNGVLQKFQIEKIELAIYKALRATNSGDFEKSRQIAERIVSRLQKEDGDVPSVEQVQDAVEEELISMNLPSAAKAYILYREKRREEREGKRLLGVEDRLKLSINAASVLRRRYLRRDDAGNVIETPEELFRRVAHCIASAEEKYNGPVASVEEEFYSMMSSFEFLPNSPTLMNAGNRLGQLSACFVLPVPDSMEGIFDALKEAALIHQSGGGTGFSFSQLRPKGDVVRSTMGIASGPVSFMEIFDRATAVIKQGGKRRGANMGILRVDHPDIFEFITAKRKDVLQNFNLSVGVTDVFMDAVEKDERFHLINPRTGAKVREVPARELFDLICRTAWETGDPGIVFLDEINRTNPVPALGEIEATNPCGEQPLLPFESCNLGSINLTKMISGGSIDWEKLAKTVRQSVRFLDNVIDVNHYPIRQIQEATLLTRKIGLGVMGWADFLAEMEIPYDSEESIELAEGLMEFIDKTAFEASCRLAEERGSFPAFDKSIYAGNRPLRNASRTTIAPTGSISIIANCSSGIEPLFALVFVRNILGGSRFLEVNHVFEKKMKETSMLNSDILHEVLKTGSLSRVQGVPEHVKRIFRTAHEISSQFHLKMQAAFQKHTNSGVSKTINLPENATIGEVRDIFLKAYELRCKGITVYRYGSRSEQVLYLGDSMLRPQDYPVYGMDFSGDCPTGDCD